MVKDKIQYKNGSHARRSWGLFGALDREKRNHFLKQKITTILLSLHILSALEEKGKDYGLITTIRLEYKNIILNFF